MISTRQLSMFTSLMNLSLEFPEIETSLIQIVKDQLKVNEVDYRISEAEYFLARDYLDSGEANKSRNRVRAITCYKHRTNVSLLQAKVLIDVAKTRGLEYANSHVDEILKNPSEYDDHRM